MVEYDPSGIEKEKECNSCSIKGYHCIGCDTLDEIVISRIKVDRTRASDEVIQGLVEALYNLTARASYFGYGFALGHEMAEAEQALTKSRQHLQSEK